MSGTVSLQKKVVVLTSEWLPWWQTNWRDSGYEKFTLVWKTEDLPKMELPTSSYNRNTLTTLKTSVNESLQMHFKVAVKTFHALNASR